MKVYKECNKTERALRIIDYNGRVRLVVVDAVTGVPLGSGHIATFHTDGRLELMGGLSTEHGLEVDMLNNNSIRLVKNPKTK